MPTLKVAPALKMFVPEYWGQAQRFQKLYSGTYALDDSAHRALTGVTSHYEKCVFLVEIAKELKLGLGVDNQELSEQGHTPAIHSKKTAAVVEAAILELYSSVDCAASALMAIYGKQSMGSKEPTSSLFRNTSKISRALPESLKSVIQGSSWYEDFRRIRNELVHAEIGAVHLNEQNGSVEYFHPGITTDNRALVRKDVFDWLDGLQGEVNQFLGEVFHYLNETLEDKPVEVWCGMTEGRALMRRVSPVGELTFDSGMCVSWKWFEKPENPTCPFKENCGAYRNKVPAEKAE